MGSNHPHITGVAVGADIDTANIAPDHREPAPVSAVYPDVHSSSTDTLVDDVKALAVDLCGGTVTIHKQVRTGPRTVDSTDARLVDGWNYAAGDRPSGTTGDDGTGAVNLDFEPTSSERTPSPRAPASPATPSRASTCNGSPWTTPARASASTSTSRPSPAAPS